MPALSRPVTPAVPAVDGGGGPALSRPVTAAFSAVTFVGVLSGETIAGQPLGAPGPLAVATTLAALLWLQRRWPVTGLLLGVATVAGQRSADLTVAGWLWPATFLYVAALLAARPRTTLVIVVAAVHAVCAFNLDWNVLQHSPGRAMAAVGTESLWLAAVVAGTLSYRNWLGWRDEILQRMRADLEEQRTAERLRVAQEVHDTVAHTLAVVGVHINVAADALDAAQEETAAREAREALRLAQDVRRKAMADLSSLVGVLRDERRPPAAPLPLGELAERVRETGLDTILTVTGDEESCPLPVRLVTSAIVREALTNTVRHAVATRVTVTVHYGAPTEVAVRDDGRGPDERPSGHNTEGHNADTHGDDGHGARVAGHGLAGLAERVAALGGGFSAGAADGGGFLVRASIPA
ncbi:histidine kinase [Dactylosporangium sp. AC04546]|uniref:sensor histidine kinase n=1 Tax=Dactylosporangium sp. AC04546 TaxID=2862460 RepID=UPI001EDE6FD6|nr:histidine kinase [Dactylosporangium sp. AC04546]WVK82442.1 histidine kinase [Dactylosporangium sp. AC04546]